MQKEIHEQPRAIADTIEAASSMPAASIPPVRRECADVLAASKACRSSPAAPATTPAWCALLARGHRRHAVRVEIASEYRYRKRGQPEAPDRHHLAVRRNPGHDGGAEVRQVAGPGRTLSICNVPESAIPRASKLVFYTRAGAEIGVASTKAFTTQLVALFAADRGAGQAARQG
jgi:glucosamine--fructose-6-phosphate aminotransferase (isomerizing)